MAYFQNLRAALAWEVVADPSPEQVQSYIGVIAAKDAPILVAAVAAHPHRLVMLDVRNFVRPEVQQTVTFLIQTPGELLADIRAILSRGLA